MEPSNTDRICVQVFAKVAAAISHEIKNTLSIINENAGLLDDLTQIAEPAAGVPSERIRSITGTIIRQVDRSNVIMKNIHLFAHSGDSRLGHANLSDLLLLMVALTSRQAAVKKISVTVDCPADIPVSTHLLTFESLLYLTLSSLYHSCIDGGTIIVEAHRASSDITICFRGEVDSPLVVENYPDENQRILADDLLASCSRKDDQLSITIPAIIE